MDFVREKYELHTTAAGNRKNSFLIIDDIIRETRPEYRFASDDHAAIIKRAIHTTADFDWLDILHFSDGVIEILRDGIMRGCTIYTDTTMALSDQQNPPGEIRLRVPLLCQRPACGCCRQRAADDPLYGRRGYRHAGAGEKIFVFGNAPTALFRVLEHAEKPVAVVGVPVGFVGAAESKDALAESSLPCIAALGRKGGSNVAAAIINAILYRMPEA